MLSRDYGEVILGRPVQGAVRARQLCALSCCANGGPIL